MWIELPPFPCRQSGPPCLTLTRAGGKGQAAHVGAQQQAARLVDAAVLAEELPRLAQHRLAAGMDGGGQGGKEGRAS